MSAYLKTSKERLSNRIEKIPSEDSSISPYLRKKALPQEEEFEEEKESLPAKIGRGAARTATDIVQTGLAAPGEFFALANLAAAPISEKPPTDSRRCDRIL